VKDAHEISEPRGPRNCSLWITSIQLRPKRLERNARIRIRISVPNSARLVRTSPISVDSQILSQLQASQDAAGFADDLRFNHTSNLDFDIETSRGKTIASAAVDLATVIQCPIETIPLCRKDNIFDDRGTFAVYIKDVARVCAGRRQGRGPSV
jgi:hypothetical protein